MWRPVSLVILIVIPSIFVLVTLSLQSILLVLVSRPALFPGKVMPDIITMRAVLRKMYDMAGTTRQTRLARMVRLTSAQTY